MVQLIYTAWRAGEAIGVRASERGGKWHPLDTRTTTHKISHPSIHPARSLRSPSFKIHDDEVVVTKMKPTMKMRDIHQRFIVRMREGRR